MPRYRTKPINKFIAQLMREADTEEISGLPRKYPQLDDKQIYAWADVDGSHRVLNALVRDSKALGITIDEFVRRLLDIKNDD